MRVHYGARRWRLLSQRAAFVEDERVLVVADAHFGKAAAFRARGVPVPRGTTEDNLARLDDLIVQLGPLRLVLLGDLFHARESHSPPTVEAMTAWRRRRAALEIVLVEGNHDHHAGAPPAALGIRVEAEPWRSEGFAYCHHPHKVAAETVVAGHLHPCVRLYGRADESLRLPCFWLRDRLLVLPAFGEFTGGASIVREDGDRVIAIAEERLFEIPAFTRAA
ncbi:MAG: ligase-associated DNA damage response endonuclease PdeM [Gemmatimonadota bacterium]